MIDEDTSPQSSPDDDHGNAGSRRRADYNLPVRALKVRDIKTPGYRKGGVAREAPSPNLPKIKPTKLRIIGGQMRGRGVMYSGDRSTRPMKDSIRETLFNILGKSVQGTIAFDLFAGTGVLAIESLSRGSVKAIAVEKAGLTAKNIRASADNIGIGKELEVLTGDAFRIGPARMREQHDLENSETAPWIVYLCPPYSMWMEMTDKMFELIQVTASLAPQGSQIVVETDKFFDPTSLPFENWDIRPKGNVTLAFLEL